MSECTIISKLTMSRFPIATWYRAQLFGIRAYARMDGAAAAGRAVVLRVIVHASRWTKTTPTAPVHVMATSAALVHVMATPPTAWKHSTPGDSWPGPVGEWGWSSVRVSSMHGHASAGRAAHGVASRMHGSRSKSPRVHVLRVIRVWPRGVMRLEGLRTCTWSPHGHGAGRERGLRGGRGAHSCGRRLQRGGHPTRPVQHVREQIAVVPSLIQTTNSKVFWEIILLVPLLKLFQGERAVVDALWVLVVPAKLLP
mmetsp:Transcript_34268/g.65459  ORF Transcript_34268/g.65459 Transcript_34268/m.65459 type:complete len:254 (+) Transcript_34268:483-1244(+)